MSIYKVSVVMSVYKEPIEWVNNSIDSILTQSFRDFEFIIVNDNPKDESLSGYLSKKQKTDNRIKIIINETNLGLTKSLNRGCELAKGEYIARMDADDISLPDRFAKQVAFLDENPEIGVCGANIEFFGSSNYIFRFPEHNDAMYFFLGTNIAHPVVMFRKNILNGVFYDPKFVVAQDYALWGRLYIEGVKFYNIQETLLKYRKSENQITVKRNDLQRDLSKKVRVEIFNHYCKKNEIPIKIEENKITVKLLDRINKEVCLPFEEKQILISYLIMSIPMGLFQFLYITLYKYSQMPLEYKIELIKNRIKGYNTQKF